MDKDKVIISEGVAADKFDRHMRKARKDDIESRQKIFVSQGATKEERAQRIAAIKPSVY